jgi:hypothetical protein
MTSDNGHRHVWADVSHQVEKTWCQHKARCQEKSCRVVRTRKYQEGKKVLERFTRPTLEEVVPNRGDLRFPRFPWSPSQESPSQESPSQESPSQESPSEGEG